MPLKVSDGIGAWIKDFKKSDAPQFKGKSEKERRDQAIAAYLSAKRGPQKEDAFTKKAVDSGKVKTGPSKARLDAIQKQKDDEKKAIDKAISKLRGEQTEQMGVKHAFRYVTKSGQGTHYHHSSDKADATKAIEKSTGQRVLGINHIGTGIPSRREDKAISKLRGDKTEAATHASADKKPEKYVDAQGKTRVRMVPVKKKVDEDFTFAVDVEGLPQMFMTGNSPGEVKSHLRKLVKQPSMIQGVKRVTKHDKKKAFRKKSMEEVTENRRDRLRAKLAAVGKDMKKTADELKKHTDEYNKKFKPKKETLDYGSDESVKLMKKMTPGQMAEDTQSEKMTFAKFRKGLYKTAKAMGDVQAVRKGKVGKRIKRRVLGKLAGKALGALTK